MDVYSETCKPLLIHRLSREEDHPSEEISQTLSAQKIKNEDSNRTKTFHSLPIDMLQSETVQERLVKSPIHPQPLNYQPPKSKSTLEMREQLNERRPIDLTVDKGFRSSGDDEALNITNIMAKIRLERRKRGEEKNGWVLNEVSEGYGCSSRGTRVTLKGKCKICTNNQCVVWLQGLSGSVSPTYIRSSGVSAEAID